MPQHSVNGDGYTGFPFHVNPKWIHSSPKLAKGSSKSNPKSTPTGENDLPPTTHTHTRAHINTKESVGGGKRRKAGGNRWVFKNKTKDNAAITISCHFSREGGRESYFATFLPIWTFGFSAPPSTSPTLSVPDKWSPRFSGHSGKSRMKYGWYFMLADKMGLVHPGEDLGNRNGKKRSGCHFSHTHTQTHRLTYT